MSEFMRFRCRGCGVLFTVDLLPDEIRVCPVCATYGTIGAASGKIALCSDCGETIDENEALTCPGCLKPLCGQCGHERDGCRACNAEADLISLPAVGRPS